MAFGQQHRAVKRFEMRAGDHNWVGENLQICFRIGSKQTANTFVVWFDPDQAMRLATRCVQWVQLDPTSFQVCERTYPPFPIGAIQQAVSTDKENKDRILELLTINKLLAHFQ